MPTKIVRADFSAARGPTVTDASEKRRRVELVAQARANVQAATAQLEAALANMMATGVDHPVLEELRETITAGRRILAKAVELSRRLPL